jgi:hypothetical protein
MPTPKPLTPEDLGGVYAKLERADESIKYLNSEIAAFLKVPEGGFSKDEEEAFRQVLKHTRRNIPPRFGVLAGEIVHHLRSSFDHIAWLLSSEVYRKSNETAIAFPIFVEEPRSKEEKASYSRKIEGITNDAAVRLIGEIQPYKAANPLDEPLAIIHGLDRVDKHHTLVLIESSWDASLKIPLSIFKWTVITGNTYDKPLPPVPPTNKLEMKFSHQVAFGEFGQRKRQPVIPSLTQLANATRDIVGLFAEL